MYTYVYAYVSGLPIYTHTYIYIYIYIYMHTFICIHTEYLLRACLCVKNARLSTLPGRLPHEPLSLSYSYIYIFSLVEEMSGPNARAP